MRCHIKNSHFGGEYICQVCTHIEQFPLGLAKHVISQHPGTDCIKCKSCNQMINYEGNPYQFEEHTRRCMSSIRNEKVKIRRGGPQSCKKCGKMLSSKNILERHLKKHLNERPYKCHHPGCDKSYVEPWALKRYGMKIFDPQI